MNHRLYTSDDFQTLIIDQHFQKCLNAEVILHFVGSSSFIRGFMARNRFSQHPQHLKRRPSVDPDDVSRWLNWISELIMVHDNDMILNCDETSWRLYPNNSLT
jgi:hypothetical protein